MKMPEPFIQYEGCKPMYTAEQMNQYGRDLLEEAAKECEAEDVAPTDSPTGVQECIAARLRKLKETL